MAFMRRRRFRRPLNVTGRRSMRFRKFLNVRPGRTMRMRRRYI